MDQRTHTLENIVPYLSHVPDRIGDEWRFSPSLAQAKRLCATRYGFAPDQKTKLHAGFDLYEWTKDGWNLIYSSPDGATSMPWDN